MYGASVLVMFKGGPTKLIDIALVPEQDNENNASWPSG